MFCFNAPNIISSTLKFICDGDNNKALPTPYEQDFITLNVTGNPTTVSGLYQTEIRCFETLTFVDCTPFSSFPILGNVDPSYIDDNTYYFNATKPFEFQWKEIICNESQICNINCIEQGSCTQSYIECEKKSKCNINCLNSQSCSNTVVNVDGDLNMSCKGDGEEMYSSSCAGLDVESADAVNIEVNCYGNACNGISMNGTNNVTLNCYDQDSTCSGVFILSIRRC